MTLIEIRHFTKDDFQMLGDLYAAVTSRGETVFWWVGDEANWPNVFIAVEGERMIGKGQVSVISEIPAGSPQDLKHHIYLNLKTRPERENDYNLYDLLYEPLLNRAYELKAALPPAHQTLIGIGNQFMEVNNTQYFISKGFSYSKSLYTMQRHLVGEMDPSALSAPYHCIQWDMPSEAGIHEYLAADMEIWPGAPIGMERLMEIRKNRAWTSFVIRENDTLVGSVMAWVDAEGDGVIEDVFVREPWRQQGIAKHLLHQALTYLKNIGCECAELQVETANSSALSLYHAVGFREVSEEVRYERDL